MKLKIKKGDTVEVIAGADKGKKGTVLTINSNRLKISVSGVRMQTHFDREQGKFEREGMIDYSNVKLVSAKKAAAPKKKAAAKK